MINEQVKKETEEVFDTIPIPRNVKKLKGRVDELKAEKKLNLEKEAKEEGISYEDLIKNKEDAAAYTVASMTPLLGDAIAIKELPKDVQEIKDLFEQGFRESDFKKLGLGTLYTAAVTAGVLPFAGFIGRAGKNVLKGVIDKTKPLMDKQVEMMSGFPPSGPDALATANNVPIKSVNETDKLLDKTNINKPIDTSLPPSIKPDEYLNAPKINPTMSGMNTPTGKLQGRRFLDLESKGNTTPEKLFEQTQVYRGEDGKLRWEIDTTDAKLKFDDTLDMRRGDYQLSNILDFDRLYKEYYKDMGAGYVALRNLKVKIRGVGDSEGTLGSYNRDVDRITLNMKAINVQAAKDAEELGIPLDDAVKLQVESTLLHEVQHAVQAREGFIRGSNVDNFLRSGYAKDYKDNATLQDNILLRLSNDLKDGLSYMTDTRKLGFLSDIEVQSKRINFIENLPSKSKTDEIKKEYMELTASRATNLELVDLPKSVKKKTFTNFNKAMDENARQKNLLDREEYIAYGKYQDVYGEKEARLVQKRFEDRYALSKIAGKDITRDEFKRETKFLNDSDGLGKMGGFNKGGTTMNMNKQMEMFDDGGLKDEGGTIDPISGNDVPIGSTQEEVRDDIPAQLSEGEFVFPADVTRFIGLEKLMQIRQEAKAGLKRMEDMGQMGNSEEATMPDDMPFDINDLDMEDEQEYNRDSQEMNQGGVIQAATGTFVNQGTNVTSVPSQFAGMNLPSSGANTAPTYTIPTIPTNVSGYMPKFTAQTGQSNQNVAPTFQTLIGNNPGQYDEMRTYVNDAGQTMDIPFKNGEPIYPIPEGYRFQDPEAIETDKPTTTTPLTKTTRVVEQDDGEGPQEPRTGRITISDPNNTKTGFKTIEVNKENIGSIKGGGYSVTDPKTGVTSFVTEKEAKALNLSGIQSGLVGVKTNFQGVQPPDLVNVLDRLSFQNDIKSVEVSKAGQALNKTLNPYADRNFIEKIVDTINGKSVQSREFDRAVRDIFTQIANFPKEEREDITNKVNNLMKQNFKIEDGKFVQINGKTDAEKRNTPVFNMKNNKVVSVDYKGKNMTEKDYADEKQQEAIDKGKTNTMKDVQDRTQEIGYSVSNQEAAGRGQQPSISYGDNSDVGSNEGVNQGGDAYGGLDFNKGGLAGKKKSKPKKMKRGGLASR